MIQALQSELLDETDAILKIHTKKSLHLEQGKGDAWRKSLINGLVPSPTAVTNLATEFAQNPRLAWACPTEWVAGNESWGRNKRTVTQLMRQCGLKRPRSLVFPAGSMLWMGQDLRTCLLNLELTRDDFSETPTLDGSFEHGLERFIGSWALATQRIMYRAQHQSSKRNLPENELQLTNSQSVNQH
jgi:lipopolysaccharide biosynthesis protein